MCKPPEEGIEYLPPTLHQILPKMNPRILCTTIFAALSAFAPLYAAAPPNILFVGNSFTHGNYAPLQGYNSSGITDTNNYGYGGIPGVFQKMTVGLGYS